MEETTTSVQVVANTVSIALALLLILMVTIYLIRLRFKPKTKPIPQAAAVSTETAAPAPAKVVSTTTRWWVEFPKVGNGFWKLLLAVGVLATLIFWLGVGNVVETGSNVGTTMREASRGFNENGPLPTTGKIQLVRTFANPQVFALGDTYRGIDVPPGAELCADPLDKVMVGGESVPATTYVRSAVEGEVVHINFYFMPYGDDCVLLTPSPDLRARTDNSSRHTYASG